MLSLFNFVFVHLICRKKLMHLKNMHELMFTQIFKVREHIGTGYMCTAGSSFMSCI